MRARTVNQREVFDEQRGGIRVLLQCVTSNGFKSNRKENQMSK